jgi:hypothetical protein
MLSARGFVNVIMLTMILRSVSLPSGPAGLAVIGLVFIGGLLAGGAIGPVTASAATAVSVQANAQRPWRSRRRFRAFPTRPKLSA